MKHTTIFSAALICVIIFSPLLNLLPSPWFLSLSKDGEGSGVRWGEVSAQNNRLLINNGAKVISTGATLVVQNGGIINLDTGWFDNSGIILITGQGDWENYATNTGFVNNSPGKVILSGDTQKIRGSSVTVFYDLILDGTGLKMLDSVSAIVTDSLVLNHLELSTDTNTMYVVSPDTGIITRTTGFVSSVSNGRLSRAVNQNATYLFPVGSSAGTLRYRPVEITPSTNNADTFKARMANVDATTEGYDRSIKDSLTCNINPDFYHLISRETGIDSVSIAVYFDTLLDGTYAGMVHWQNQLRWEDMGNVTVVNNVSPALSSITKTIWSDFTYQPFALSIPAPPVALAQSDSVICSGDSISFTSSPAGYANYEFFVNNISGQSSASNVFSASNLSTGDTIRVEAFDSAGCIGYSNLIFNITINPNPIPVITAADTAFCSGDSTQLTAAATTAYQWSSGDSTQTIIVNSGGIYFLTVTDANGCPGMDSIAITMNNNPVPVITAADTAFCSGDSTLLTATAASTYQWSNGDTTQNATVNTGGNYSITVTDANSCTGIVSITITVNNNPVPVITATDTAFCSGDSTQLTASATTAYQWSNGDTTQNTTVNTGGNYSITVTDGNGCTGLDSITITMNNNPVPVITAADTAFCSGDSTLLTATAATDYQWSNGDTMQNATVNTGGNYSITVTDANGCTGTDNITITMNNNPVPVITAADTAFCSGDSTLLTATAATDYQWSNGDTTQSTSVNSTGNYSVTVTDINGCSGSDSISILVFTNPVPVISANGPTTFCQGNSVTLSSNIASGNLWNNGNTNQNMVVDTSGTYSVTVLDTNGCTGVSLPIAVTVNNNPVPVITAADTAFCQGDSTLLTVTSAALYLWSNTATTQSTTVTTAGMFYVLVSDSNGCDGSDSISILVFNNPAPIITANGPTTFCQGDSVTLSSSSNTGNQWSNGGTTQNIAISVSGTYTVTVLDSNGCVGASMPIVVSVNSNPVPLISGNISFCSGDSTQLATTAASIYQWSNGATTQNITVLTGGNYSVTITDANGCTGSSAPASITVNSLPTADAGSNVTINLGTSVTLTASASATYLWSPPQGLSCTNCQSPDASPQTTTTYYVTVTSASGCSAVDSVTVEVLSEYGVILPNIFSPNGDGNNDELFVRGKGIETVKLLIYDRWGEKVFETTELSNGWDGKYKGKEMNSAVFVYMLYVKFYNGEEVNKHGNITLIR